MFLGLHFFNPLHSLTNSKHQMFISFRKTFQIRRCHLRGRPSASDLQCFQSCSLLSGDLGSLGTPQASEIRRAACSGVGGASLRDKLLTCVASQTLRLTSCTSIKDLQICGLKLLFFPGFFNLLFWLFGLVLGLPGGSKIGLKTKKIGFGISAFPSFVF